MAKTKQHARTSARKTTRCPLGLRRTRRLWHVCDWASGHFRHSFPWRRAEHRSVAVCTDSVTSPNRQIMIPEP